MKITMKVMDAADKWHIKVSFHIEPYHNRAGQTIVDDVAYIIKKYRSHPAYFRDPDHSNCDALYIWDSLYLNDTQPLEPLKDKHYDLTSWSDTKLGTHFGGYYIYGVRNDLKEVEKWKKMNDYCKSHDLMWVPSVGPGYLDRRAKPQSKGKIVDRVNGSSYDINWKIVFDSGIPAWITVTTFNEWNEGTHIEPSSHDPPKSYGYLTYEGSYNKTGN